MKGRSRVESLRMRLDSERKRLQRNWLVLAAGTTVLVVAGLVWWVLR